jgi:hypothetical protein
MDSAKGLSTGSKSSEEHFAAGLAYIQQGEYENALVEFSMAIRCEGAWQVRQGCWQAGKLPR